MRAEVAVSVIIPAHNEAESLPRVLAETAGVLAEWPGGGEIVVCDDGSTDGTAQVLARAQADVAMLRVERHARRRGVGRALRTLYGAARGERVLFLPADGQVRAPVLHVMAAAGADCCAVVGRRRRRADPLWRRINAGLYNALVRWRFGLPVHDVDSVTLLRRDALGDLEALRSRGAGVGLELLLRIQRRGGRVCEVDVPHEPRRAGRQTGGSPGFIVTGLLDLARLWITCGQEIGDTHQFDPRK